MLIVEEKDLSSLVQMLSHTWPSRDCPNSSVQLSDLDLNHWIPVMEKLKQLLEEMDPKTSNHTEIEQIKSILFFLGDLLFIGRHKGCCYFLEVLIILLILKYNLFYYVN